LAPGTEIMGQFLGPETQTFCHFLVQKVFSSSSEFRPIEKEEETFEHALDNV
jgi:hypothetical protein